MTVATAARATSVPPWKVMAWQLSDASCASDGFVAASKQQALRGVACLQMGVERAVTRVDYRRDVVVGAYVGFPTGGWLIAITDIWQPGSFLAVDTTIVHRGGRAPVLSTAYQVVRMPRTQLARALPSQVVVATDAAPRLRIEVLERADARAVVATYTQHPVLIEDAVTSLYRRRLSYVWTLVGRRSAPAGTREVFRAAAKPGIEYRAATTTADGRTLLAWSRPV